MKATNFLVIMSDEHNPKIMGCAGNPVAKTPHLDRLAAEGTRFSAAYTPSPICVPGRASFATGQWVHKIRYWDNAMAYDGLIPSWGHRLQATGHRVDSIGKLHYRNDVDPAGFDEEIVPLNVVNGLGDLMGMVRNPPPRRRQARKQVENAAMGESTYTQYDREILRQSVRWLTEEAPKHEDKPWTLFVSFVCPHFPLVAPDEFFKLYTAGQMPWPVGNDGKQPDHPAIAERWHLAAYDEGFSEEQIRTALTAYYGMVSFLDDNIGQLLQTLQETGLMENTRVLYTSDHGDNLGRNNLWGKSTMYEDSAGVPLLLAGADVPKGKVVDTPANLVDVFPTVVQCVGEPTWRQDTNLPGVSLFDLADGTAKREVTFSEYHASGSSAGISMVRKGAYKYVYYCNFPPQLFDLRADPDETRNLAGDPAYQDVQADLHAELHKVVDPHWADRLAKNDQAQRISDMGGEEAIVNRGTFGYTPAPGEAVNLTPGERGANG